MLPGSVLGRDGRLGRDGVAGRVIPGGFGSPPWLGRFRLGALTLGSVVGLPPSEGDEGRFGRLVPPNDGGRAPGLRAPLGRFTEGRDA
ncbi:hypothetical protein Pla175_36610 [Pirellulimonas nuda]|uniref:Uncharacterized protein n=2 Tax=Pirellulimonas nuda TaxID=2528009 RepID=A0A518DFK5_9BACT|nr:hypothetical protein Pla175_36610 [Pirellulimonas nuda]